MKRAFAILLATSMFASSALADTYSLEETHTYAYFTINHLGRGDFTGVFKNVSGTVVLDEGVKDSVEVEIVVSSVDTFNKKRDEHVLGPDFFNAKRYKKIKFKSSSIKKIDDRQYTITGELSFHGKKKKITAKLVRGVTGNDPWGKYRTGGNVFFEIDRREFGLKGFAEPALGHTVKINLYWEAIRTKQAS